jgi:acetyl-CoA acetyltransferase
VEEEENMPDTLRGAAAIVGFGELKPERSRPGRTAPSLLAEAAYLAIQDAGLTKADIDGMILEEGMAPTGSGYNPKMAEYMGIFPTFATGCDAQGAAGVTMALQAAAYVQAGLAKYVLCGMSAAAEGPRRSPRAGSSGPPRPAGQVRTDTTGSEFAVPYGPTVGANGWYAMIAKRYEALYGATVEKRAKICVDLRTNANHNPMAIFHDTPITIEDVVNSRIVADPLHLLECVMPCAGACAFIVARADVARDMPHKPAYILGGALGILRSNLTHVGEITESPVGRAAPKAFAMAGYKPEEIQVMEIYDSFTITVMCELEESGFCKKGEAVDWIWEHDMTFKGDKPLNTHGGQLSYGQASTAGGCAQVTEAVRQIRREAGEPQVPGSTDLVYVTGSGGSFSQQSALLLGSEATL